MQNSIESREARPLSRLYLKGAVGIAILLALGVGIARESGVAISSQELLYTARSGTGSNTSYDIFRYDVRTKTSVNITQTASIDELNPQSLSDTKIAYTVWNQGEIQNITISDTEQSDQPPAVNLHHLQILASPDSKFIAYTGMDENEETKVGFLDRQTNQVHDIPVRLGNSPYLLWSEDKLLIFTHIPHRFGGTNKYYVQAMDGSSPVEVDKDSKLPKELWDLIRTASTFNWQEFGNIIPNPDNSSIAFTASDEDSIALNTYIVDKRTGKLLLRLPHAVDATWVTESEN